VSATAQGPLSARFSEHNFATRQDEAADRLMRALPGVPRLGLRLTTGPVLLAHRVTGYVPRAFRYPFEGDVPPQYEASARIWFFDAAVDRYLPDVAQFVILGAGFDTRAYRLPSDTRVRVFEVDSPQTQLVKRETLQKVGIDSSAVTFVAADFEKDDWLVCLSAAGFAAGERTLFLWEGVTMYLTREAVEDSLRKSLRRRRGVWWRHAAPQQAWTDRTTVVCQHVVRGGGGHLFACLQRQGSRSRYFVPGPQSRARRS
jgi:Leucine carboxyl methyltransferase